MTLSSFFKPQKGNPIFVTQEAAKDAFTDIKADFNLSRALYTSIPHKDQVHNVQLGNFCTKTYINTFSWYIGIPSVASSDDDFSAAINGWFKRNRSLLLRMIQQALVDGKHYIWLRTEHRGSELKIIPYQVSRELVDWDHTVRDPFGGFKVFVFTIDHSDYKTTWTIEPGKESFSRTGQLPEGVEESGENSSTQNELLVFELHNNKQAYLSEGLPEIAPVVPFIQRYDSILRKLGKHVDDGLVPRMFFRVKNMLDFLIRSFSLKKDDILAGRINVPAESFQNFYVEEPTDEVRYLQKDDRSASALKVLELLYYIIIEMTMPEYLYGASLNSTNASVSEQSPVWTKKVEGKQGEFDEFFYWLSEKFLLLMNGMSGRAKYKPQDIEIKWPEVAAKDDVAMMTAFSSLMTAIQSALDLGLIGPDTAFNAMKQYIPVSGDYETEQAKVLIFQKKRLEVENIKARLNEGDVDVGELMNHLFKKGASR